MTSPYFLGIDIGTQGARVVLVDSQGTIVASSQETFNLDNNTLEVQSPKRWWEACLNSLTDLLSAAKQTISVTAIKAVAVTSTSGTVIPMGLGDQPLHSAIMYSDKRSAKEAELCREVALEAGQEGYIGFNSSSGLPKMVWFVRRFPEKAEKIVRWAHAADYITGKLSGEWGISDYTNALKSGYDIRNQKWPSYIYERLPLNRQWLPEVLPSGTPIGTISPRVARPLGLPSSLKVVTGMTDGCASQFAAGAVNPGDWNTTIGTTLVIKGVTREPIEDPENRLYNHRHPEGWWMPGGASNTGADWIARDFSNDLETLNKQAANIFPTDHLVYPLARQGERFPFIAPKAEGFAPDWLNRSELFTAGLEGVAYIERYAYEVIQALSGERVKAVYTAGGGSESDVWLAIRSNVLNVPIYKMKYVKGAVGAAALAASKTHFSSITESVSALIQIDKMILPTDSLVSFYNDNYGRFIEQLRSKGYIKKQDQHA